MRRYPLVIAGTLAGTAAVLAFPVHKPTLSIPSSGAGAAGTTSGSAATGSTSGGGGASTSAPAAAGPQAPATSAPATTPTTAGSTPAVRTATGADQQFQYGDIAVTVTVRGTKVTGVKIASINETDGRSVSIDQYAVPQLERQAVSAGSANIDGVSGATFTSQAFVDSLSSALAKLGIA